MPLGKVQFTTSVAKVLREFLDNPTEFRYGLELMRASGLKSGALYPILARLENAGVLESVHEDVNPVAVGRPARHFYRLTPDGAAFAHARLTELSAQLRPPA